MSAPSHHYHFNVKMTCGGCSGAIDRVLKKLQASNESLASYKVSLEDQTADVMCGDGLPFDEVLGKIKKTGKTVLGAEKDGEKVEL